MKLSSRFFHWSMISQPMKNLVVFYVALAVLNLIGIGFINAKYILLSDIVLIALTVFYYYPEIGLYLMIFLYPFSGWQLTFDSINLPYSDLAALMLFVSVALKITVQVIVGKETFKNIFKENFPSVLFAGLFFLAGFLSLINVDFRMSSIKYLLRPMIFFYLMFVVLPYYLIKDKVIFKRALYSFLAAGIVVAGLGLLSVAFPQGANVDLNRAVPYAIAGFNLVAGNQNAIAEILIVVLPITMLLFLLTERIKERGWYVLIGILFCFVTLMTFSRAGWLALMVELLVLYFIQRRHLVNRYVLAAIIFVVILVLAIFYFTVWQNIDWIKTSNANRLLLTHISLSAFWEHPFIGHGLNTFQDIIGRTFVYTVEFGEPLESHGFVQKLMTETGSFGLITFLILLGSVAQRLWQGFLATKGTTAKAIVSCLIILFCGLVTFEFFSTSYFLAIMWLPLGVALAGVKLYAK
ncbi:MAG: O-antigen ligase family protein [Patescibacteria group bacterium]